MKKPLVVFIVGPTATGKSRIAVELARKMGGEIVSADSMLVYKGMDIGTAKPSKADRKKIPHHLIDILSPSQNFSVFDYRKKALATIKSIAKRNKIPIVTGGTGLYVRALLEGWSSQPGQDMKLRKSLEEESRKDLPGLYERLKIKDSERASQIKQQDARRIVRALEILVSSQKSPSSWHREKKDSLESLGYRVLVFGINKDRALLYANIEKRVDAMFRKGLVREVQKLSKKKLSKTAMQAVGYKEILQAINEGAELESAKERIKKNSRHLAKRQITWFKRERGIQWIVLGAREKAISAVSHITHYIKNT